VWLAAGRHEVSVRRANGASATAVVQITAGAEQDLAIQLEGAPERATAVAGVATSAASAPPLVARSSRSGWRGRTWTWVAAGSAVLCAGGATTFGLLMQSKYDELNRTCGSGSPTRPGCNQSDLDSLDRRKTAANLLWGAAGAAALTAGVLYFIEGHRRVTLSPVAEGFTGLLAAVRY